MKTLPVITSSWRLFTFVGKLDIIKKVVCNALILFYLTNNNKKDILKTWVSVGIHSYFLKMSATKFRQNVRRVKSSIVHWMGPETSDLGKSRNSFCQTSQSLSKRFLSHKVIIIRINMNDHWDKQNNEKLSISLFDAEKA
jgi:hypothetical protein